MAATFQEMVGMLLLPLILVAAVAGWLIYAARGRRAVRLILEGFGVRLYVTSRNRSSTDADSTVRAGLDGLKAAGDKEGGKSS